MCKLRKPLNPKAEEWRPTPPPPTFPPSLPSQSLSKPTPPHLMCYHPQPSYNLLPHYAQGPPPVYAITFPAKATDSLAPPEPEKLEQDPAVESAVVKRGERRKSPRLDFFRISRRNQLLPPRLRIRGAIRSHTHSHPPPPPPKLEWRPKTSENSDLKVSAEAGVAASPLTTSENSDLKVSAEAGVAASPLTTSENSDLKVSGEVAAAAPPSPPTPKAKTTIMIRNIPNQLRREDMLKFLDDKCKIHSLEYDFFYLPFDFRKRGNLGYAFVNCTNSDTAMKMMKVLDNFKWRSKYRDDGYVYSRKVCVTTWARIQGKEALVRRFQKSSFKCDDVEFLPVVLDPPRDGSDPNPPPPLNIGRLCPPPF